MPDVVKGREGLDPHEVPDWESMYVRSEAQPFDPAPTRAEWLGLLGLLETAGNAYDQWACGLPLDKAMRALGRALGKELDPP